MALGGVWAEAGELPGATHGAHFRARARSVIFLFMCGGVSHLDTFDPKGNAHAGRLIDAVGFDKKRLRATIRIVAPRAPGDVVLHDLPIDEVPALVQALFTDL